MKKQNNTLVVKTDLIEVVTIMKICMGLFVDLFCELFPRYAPLIANRRLQMPDLEVKEYEPDALLWYGPTHTYEVKWLLHVYAQNAGKCQNYIMDLLVAELSQSALHALKNFADILHDAGPQSLLSPGGSVVADGFLGHVFAYNPSRRVTCVEALRTAMLVETINRFYGYEVLRLYVQRWRFDSDTTLQIPTRAADGYFCKLEVV